MDLHRVRKSIFRDKEHFDRMSFCGSSVFDLTEIKSIGWWLVSWWHRRNSVKIGSSWINIDCWFMTNFCQPYRHWRHFSFITISINRKNTVGECTTISIFFSRTKSVYIDSKTHFILSWKIDRENVRCVCYPLLYNVHIEAKRIIKLNIIMY